MSLEDYNRGYQSGWSGIATGPPRSASEVVGQWNAQDDRRRAMMSGSPSAGAAGGGAENGHYVIAGLVAGAAGILYTGSILGSVPGALAGVLAIKVLVWAGALLIRLLAWVFRPIPVFKLALLGAAGALALQWAFREQIGGMMYRGPVMVGLSGALFCLQLAVVARIILAPIFMIARRRPSAGR